MICVERYDNNTIISEELKTALMIDAYQKGYLSMGQLSKALNQSKEKSLKMLSLMGVDAIDYDFEDDMKFMDSFNHAPHKNPNQSK